LKHRNLIKQTVRELVDSRTGKSGVSAKLEQLLGEKVDAEERVDVVNSIERELTSLHEGNIARFKIGLRSFQNWSASWQNPGE
jgi:hypothetical protein